MARRRIAIGSQVVVEAPAENLLTQRRRNRLMLRVGISGQCPVSIRLMCGVNLVDR